MAADSAHMAADAEIEAFQREVAGIYAEAQKTASRTLTEYLERFREEDDEWRERVSRGEATEAQWRAWRRGKILTGRRYRVVLKQVSEGYTHANEVAMDALDGRLPGVYAENYNYGTFQTYSAAGVDDAFALQDASTVQRLLADHGSYLPKPTVNAPKDVAWNRRLLANQITQGVLLGESMAKIARRVQAVTGSNMAAAVRTARTSVTAAENAGRVDSYRRAQSLGIKLEQEWLATLDGRTRHTHRQLDGERVEVGGKFANGCRYPGDPEAPYAETCNCRCTLKAAVKGVDQSDAKRWSRLPEGMTYEQWKYQHSTKEELAGIIEGRERAEAAIARKMAKMESVGYDGVWRYRVTMADYAQKKDAVQAKVDYFKGEMRKLERGSAEYERLKANLATVRKFARDGKKYEALKAELERERAKTGRMRAVLDEKLMRVREKAARAAGGNRWSDAYTEARKRAALDFRRTADADKAFREVSGRTWRASDKAARSAAYQYTQGSGGFNRPLSGYRKPWSLPGSGWEPRFYVGPNRVWLDYEGKGDAIRRLTDMISRSTYGSDAWLYRGCDANALESFLGIAQGALGDLTDDELQAYVKRGHSARIQSFVSTAVNKGAGFSHKPIIMHIYAPEGSEMLYAEPFSHYGRGAGENWDGISGQKAFGSEAEMIIQRGGEYRLTGIRREGGKVYVEMEHHPEKGYDKFQQDDTEWNGSREGFKD